MKDTPFFMERSRLLEGAKGPLEQKHLMDRTTGIVRKYRTSEEALRRDRAATLSCLSARPGKGGVVFDICDRPEFDRLQEAIASHVEELQKLEAAMCQIDSIIAANNMVPWLDDLKQQLSSTANSIYTQKNLIAKLVVFHSAQNPQSSPEEVLKLPEFVSRREEADSLIEKEKQYLAKYKPLVEEIESHLESVGC